MNEIDTLGDEMVMMAKKLQSEREQKATKDITKAGADITPSMLSLLNEWELCEAPTQYLRDSTQIIMQTAEMMSLGTSYVDENPAYLRKVMAFCLQVRKDMLHFLGIDNSLEE